jgi:hypothetical protein
MAYLRHIALCALILLTLAAPHGAPAAPRAADETPPAIAEELRGMVVRDPWYDCNPAFPGGPREPNRAAQSRMGAILRQTGVRWVRLEFFVTDKPGGLEETFRCYDYFMNQVAPANNLRVLGLLGFGLVRDRDPLDLKTGIISTTVTTDPIYGGAVNVYMRDWLSRALAISTRYSGRDGSGALSAIEVLNEQNRMPPNGDAVPADIAARLHTKFYRLFKIDQREPGAAGAWRDSVPIIIGGLHPRGSGPDPSEKESDVAYLRQYFGYPALGGAPVPSKPFQDFKARVGRYPVDGLAYHPYPAEIVLPAQLDLIEAEMARIQSRLGAVRSALAELGAAQLPLWITEIGYDAGRVQQSVQGQATFMRTVFRLLAARGDVHTVFWFKYEDFPGSPNAPNRWGIVRIPFTLSPSCEGGACYEPSGEPDDWRPAYLAYRELAGATIHQIYLPKLQNIR